MSWWLPMLRQRQGHVKLKHCLYTFTKANIQLIRSWSLLQLQLHFIRSNLSTLIHAMQKPVFSLIQRGLTLLPVECNYTCLYQCFLAEAVRISTLYAPSRKQRQKPVLPTQRAAALDCLRKFVDCLRKFVSCCSWTWLVGVWSWNLLQESKSAD